MADLAKVASIPTLEVSGDSSPAENQQAAVETQPTDSALSHLNWYYDLSNSALHGPYKEFHAKRNGSIGFMYLISVIQTFLCIPAFFASLCNDFLPNPADIDTELSRIVLRRLTSVLTFSCLLVCTLCLWYILLTRTPKDDNKNSFSNYLLHKVQQIMGIDEAKIQSKSTNASISSLCTITNIFYLCGQSYYCLMYVRKVFGCFAPIGTPDHLTCFETEANLQLLIIDPYLSIIVPLLNWVLVTDVSIGVFWCSYSINLCVVLALETFVTKYPAVSRLVMTISLCLFFVVDIQIRNVSMFFTAVELKHALQDVKRMEEETRKNEMRNMIANVAHDMKTPLASFVTGMDFIQHVLEELKVSLNNYTPPTTRSGTKQANNFPNVMEAILSIEQCLLNIRNTNSFMLMTINRCIDYTKASKGMSLVPRYETIHLAESLELPLSCMKNIQQRVEIKLNTVADNICSHIITDKQWLQENILCLLSNAVKFTTDGDVVISVSLQRASEERIGTSLGSPDQSFSKKLDKPYLDASATEFVLYFEIQDSGVGIPEDAVHQLFKPFRQIQRMTGGTGLGLYSLAKRIEALNGIFGAKPRDDGQHGAVFWFTVPYRPDPMSAKLAKLSVETKRGDGTTSNTHTKSTHSTPSPCEGVKVNTTDADAFRKLHILVVDDSPAIIKLTTMLLKRIGHTTSTAENGLMATKKVAELWENQHEQYDVILMDLQMPVMDGLEATKRIRDYEIEQLEKNNLVEDPKLIFQHQILIAMSANSDNETSDSSLQAGADTFMCKPFNVQSFNDTIKNFL